MRIYSIRKDFETDHSSRSYGYIDGVNLDYSYGDWTGEFRIPYKTELYKKLKKFDKRSMQVEKVFNKIKIEIELYSEELEENEYEWAALFNEIREEVNDNNLEPLKVIEAYHTDIGKFESMKTKTELAKRLQEILTKC